MADTPKKRTRRAVVKPIPEEAYTNRQLNLFQEFFAENSNAFSNAIDFWDSVPRFSISRKKQEQLRLPGGFLPISKIEFRYRGETFTAHIRPARLELRDENGKTTHKTAEYYPSAREELIEHALRKIAVEQAAGFFYKQDFRSGCRFSLYQLRRELESQGHSLRYDELMEGLDILSMSNIEFESEENGSNPNFAQSTYFPLLAGVNKKEYAADPKARWIVQFHPLITDSIQQITYRQFNYKRLMNCRTQIARWLISQLVLKYTQAALTNSFEMRYSTIKRDSALLEGYARNRDAITALDAAWKEIKGLNVIASIKKVEQRGIRAKLEDVIYTLFPSMAFSTEQKAANRRQGDAKATTSPLQQQTLSLYMGKIKDPHELAVLVDKTDPTRKKQGE